MGGQSHSDHHALWINPRNGQHLIIGNDGGVDISYDQGTTWEELSLAALGQFYAISVDMRKPYYVCGGLQDNGSWCGPSAVRSAAGIMNADWYRTGGGDGFYTANDPRDWTIIYTESQDGATNRYDLKTGQSRSIRPTPPFAPPPTPPAAPAAQPEAQGRGAVRARPPRRKPRPAAVAVAAAAPVPATSCLPRLREPTTASTGARRSCSRTTTRARCISAAIGCSSRQPAVIRGRRRRT